MNEPWRTRLIDAAMRDHTTRARLMRAGALNEGYNAEMEALHLQNAALLNDAFDALGWPGRGLIGDDGAGAAFLILQHAISRPDLQRRGLALMLEAIPKGEANALDAAYLSDRIAVMEGRGQTFGTQFDWDAQGLLSPAPIAEAWTSAAPISACRRWPTPSPACARTPPPKAMRRRVISPRRAEYAGPPRRLARSPARAKVRARRHAMLKWLLGIVLALVGTVAVLGAIRVLTFKRDDIPTQRSRPNTKARRRAMSICPAISACIIAMKACAIRVRDAASDLASRPRCMWEPWVARLGDSAASSLDLPGQPHHAPAGYQPSIETATWWRALWPDLSGVSCSQARPWAATWRGNTRSPIPINGGLIRGASGCGKSRYADDEPQVFKLHRPPALC